MVRRRRLIWLSAPVVVGLLSLVSCSVDTDSGTSVGPPGTQSGGCAGCLDVIAVRVNPSQPSLTVGMTVQLTASATTGGITGTAAVTVAAPPDPA